MQQGQMMDLGLPQGMNVIHMGDSLEITRRWLSIANVILTFFTLFWCGFLAFWYLKAVQTREWLMLLFPILHVLAGVFLAYSTLAGYLNTTTARVDWSTLSIRHGPLPWPGNRTFDVRDIKQVYVKRHISHSRSQTVTYEVHALTHSGKNLKLLGGFANDEQALFIEQEIEKFLRIKDMPVRGEYGQGMTDVQVF